MDFLWEIFFGSLWIRSKSESNFIPKLGFIFQVFDIVTNFMSPSGVTKWTKVASRRFSDLDNRT